MPRDVFRELKKPENGIGWTPDQFELTMFYPNGPYKDPGTYTWEQVTERARRLIESAGDPVFGVGIKTVDPIGYMMEDK